MKKICLMTVMAIMAVVSCSKYDDSALNNRIDDLEDRLAKLETLCNQMNSNITSLQGIVNALKDSDYITGIAPVTIDGVEVGYTISFNKGDVMTIYHGKDGVDGHTPIIGVKQGSDGVYYWTLDGEWLLDSYGNKVKAQGEDGEDGYTGKDGITPKLKIENEYWYVSYDEGKTWTKLDKATGEDGKSMFRDVSYDEGNVYFVLLDGTELTVPRTQPLDITFDKANPVDLAPESTMEIGYTIKGASENVTIEVTSSNELKARVIPSDKMKGKIEIKSGTVIDEYSKVIVVVSDGNNTILRSITFNPAQVEIFEISPKNVSLSMNGGEFKVTVVSTIGYKLSSVPAWIKEVKVDEDKATHTFVHTFKAEANTVEESRTAPIVFCNDKQVCIPVAVTQAAYANWEEEAFYHRSVAMRFTATWCTFCPIMAETIKRIQNEMPGKLEHISIHTSGSDLYFNKSLALESQYLVNQYPTGIVDGRVNVYGHPEFMEAIEQSQSIYPAASGISFTSSVSDNKITVDGTVYLKKAETYKVTVLAVEDNIVSPQVGAEDDYVHSGVARLAFSDILGDVFTVQSDNSTKDFSYTATVPNRYNKDNMRIVVYVQRQFGSQERIQSGNYGDYYIDNCASGALGTTVELRMAE